MLDPNYRLFWCEDLPKKSSTEIDEIKKRCIAIINDEISSIRPSEKSLDKQTEKDEVQVVPSNKFTFLNYKSKLLSQNANENSNEVDEYLIFNPPELICLDEDNSVMDINVFKFWKTYENRFPKLAKLFNKIYSISASTSPVERVFSRAGLRTINRRAKTGVDTLSSIVFLEVNKNYIS